MINTGFFRYLIPPVLLATYPIFFLFHENSVVVNINSLYLPLALLSITAIVFYCILYFLFQCSPPSSSTGTMMFLVFFYLYGTVFKQLRAADFVAVNHYTLLPLVTTIALYAAFFAARMEAKYSRFISRGAVFVFSGLIFINLIGIAYAEYGKKRRLPLVNPLLDTQGNDALKRPDIYYMLFDETSGFEAIRDYWKYEENDQFISYLDEMGFFIPEKSRSTTIDTLIEMSSRLNYKEYSFEEYPGAKFFYDEIAQNKVMHELKSLGYTTVVFDQTLSTNVYPAKTPILADYSFASDPSFPVAKGPRIDGFARMIFDLTLFRPIIDSDLDLDPTIADHRSNVLYAFDKIANLDGISSPKFVYAHILLTHTPFVFDEYGGLVDSNHYYDWNYYLGTYIFQTKKIVELVDNLIENSDPENPPVVVLQSDHGARNQLIEIGAGGTTLPNYPEEYKHHILNALYLPGYNYSLLPSDLMPVNTFPLIFDFYFKNSDPEK